MVYLSNVIKLEKKNSAFVYIDSSNVLRYLRSVFTNVTKNFQE